MLENLKFTKKSYKIFSQINTIQLENSEFNDKSSNQYKILNSIDLDFTRDVTIMDIKYEDIFYFLKGLGGISVVFKFVILLIVKIIVQKQW